MAVKKSAWIKVQKQPAGTKGRGKEMFIQTRTSPRKCVQLSRQLNENPKGTEFLSENEKLQPTFDFITQ